MHEARRKSRGSWLLFGLLPIGSSLLESLLVGHVRFCFLQARHFRLHELIENGELLLPTSATRGFSLPRWLLSRRFLLCGGHHIIRWGSWPTTVGIA